MNPQDNPELAAFLAVQHGLQGFTEQQKRSHYPEHESRSRHTHKERGFRDYPQRGYEERHPRQDWEDGPPRPMEEEWWKPAHERNQQPDWSQETQQWDNDPNSAVSARNDRDTYRNTRYDPRRDHRQTPDGANDFDYSRNNWNNKPSSRHTATGANSLGQGRDPHDQRHPSRGSVDGQKPLYGNGYTVHAQPDYPKQIKRKPKNYATIPGLPRAPRFSVKKNSFSVTGYPSKKNKEKNGFKTMPGLPGSGMSGKKGLAGMPTSSKPKPKMKYGFQPPPQTPPAQDPNNYDEAQEQPVSQPESPAVLLPKNDMVIHAPCPVTPEPAVRTSHNTWNHTDPILMTPPDFNEDAMDERKKPQRRSISPVRPLVIEQDVRYPGAPMPSEFVPSLLPSQDNPIHNITMDHLRSQNEDNARSKHPFAHEPPLNMGGVFPGPLDSPYNHAPLKRNKPSPKDEQRQPTADDGPFYIPLSKPQRTFLDGVMNKNPAEAADTKPHNPYTQHEVWGANHKGGTWSNDLPAPAPTNDHRGYSMKKPTTTKLSVSAATFEPKNTPITTDYRKNIDRIPSWNPAMNTLNIMDPEPIPRQPEPVTGSAIDKGFRAITDIESINSALTFLEEQEASSEEERASLIKRKEVHIQWITEKLLCIDQEPTPQGCHKVFNIVSMLKGRLLIYKVVNLLQTKTAGRLICLICESIWHFSHVTGKVYQEDHDMPMVVLNTLPKLNTETQLNLFSRTIHHFKTIRLDQRLEIIHTKLGSAAIEAIIKCATNNNQWFGLLDEFLKLIPLGKMIPQHAMHRGRGQLNAPPENIWQIITDIFLKLSPSQKFKVLDDEAVWNSVREYLQRSASNPNIFLPPAVCILALEHPELCHLVPQLPPPELSEMFEQISGLMQDPRGHLIKQKAQPQAHNTDRMPPPPRTPPFPPFGHRKDPMPLLEHSASVPVQPDAIGTRRETKPDLNRQFSEPNPHSPNMWDVTRPRRQMIPNSGRRMDHKPQPQPEVARQEEFERVRNEISSFRGPRFDQNHSGEMSPVSAPSIRSSSASPSRSHVDLAALLWEQSQKDRDQPVEKEVEPQVTEDPIPAQTGNFWSHWGDGPKSSAPRPFGGARVISPQGITKKSGVTRLPPGLQQPPAKRKESPKQGEPGGTPSPDTRTDKNSDTLDEDDFDDNEVEASQPGPVAAPKMSEAQKGPSGSNKRKPPLRSKASKKAMEAMFGITRQAGQAGTEE